MNKRRISNGCTIQKTKLRITSNNHCIVFCSFHLLITKQLSNKHKFSSDVRYLCGIAVQYFFTLFFLLPLPFIFSLLIWSTNIGITTENKTRKTKTFMNWNRIPLPFWSLQIQKKKICVYDDVLFGELVVKMCEKREAKTEKITNKT